MPSPSPFPSDGTSARRAALVMLDAVLRKGQTLDSASAAARGLPQADAAHASAIAGETLRRLPDLDELIDSATRQRLPDDSKARMVLRLALAQKIGLDTPDHAIVATALPLVDGGPRRLVHGVLGTLLRRGLPKSDHARLPDDVESRWRRAWGDDVVAAARRAIIKRPLLDLSFADQSSADGFATFLGGIKLAPFHVRLDNNQPVEKLPGFDEGRWWVQDLAASIPARLMPTTARIVLDACAAPGGKTLQLASMNLSVTAMDRSESRLARLRANLKRTKQSATIVMADLLEWSNSSVFDGILLDAPCSSTGTFRRHPEVLYRARGKVINEMADQQLAMLSEAAGYLKPGGTIIYSVCSLEPQEGEKVVTDFLASNSGFAISRPDPGELPDGVASSPEGWVRILPGMLADAGGLDGFFVARLVGQAK